MAEKSIDHKPFLALAQSMRAEPLRLLNRNEIKIIVAHADWLINFIEQRRKAAGARRTFGPQRKPDTEVKPESLKRREYRDRKKIAK